MASVPPYIDGNRQRAQIIIEGPQEYTAEAQARLVRCMQQPFVRDRDTLRRLKPPASPPASHEAQAEWDACYHCGLRLPLSVDAGTADNWYDAK